MPVHLLPQQSCDLDGYLLKMAEAQDKQDVGAALLIALKYIDNE